MQKIRIEFPKVPWPMDDCIFIRLCGLVVELHMHTNVYARACSLSVTCQVAMAES